MHSHRVYYVYQILARSDNRKWVIIQFKIWLSDSETKYRLIKNDSAFPYRTKDQNMRFWHENIQTNAMSISVQNRQPDENKKKRSSSLAMTAHDHTWGDSGSIKPVWFEYWHYDWRSEVPDSESLIFLCCYNSWRSII